MKFTDEIANIEWTNDSKKKTFKRNNISFASKYVHFKNNRKPPIYDSYIWILIKAYLAKIKGISPRFTEPKSYAEFYQAFIEFKNEYDLNSLTNYDIDKSLWTYSKLEIQKILEEDRSKSLEQAKAELKRRIKNQLNSHQNAQQ